MTGKLLRDCGQSPMVRKLADGIEKEVNRTEAVCLIFREEVPTRGISFEFAKQAWLKDFRKMLDYFPFRRLTHRRRY